MLTGKAVVVTGAGAGIGRELTLRLAKRGATVWALDIDEGALSALKDEASKFGQDLHTRRCDVTDVDAMKLARDEIESRGLPLGIWVNNAGVAGLGAFQELELADFFRVIEINLKGLIIGTRVALEAMERAGEGLIVNMASVAGHLPAPFMSAYNAAKHGVVGFTRSLQAELSLRASPVKLMMVSPGFVDTQIIAKGSKLGFPAWLSFLLATPESVADEVLRGIDSGRDEIYPTLNGKVMRRLYRFFPKTTVKSSKILLAKSWKDVLFNRYET